MNNNLLAKVENIRNSIDIVDVISRYENVITKGKGHYAICPFHNDTNPSLSISSDKQIFKCFVCGVGGDAFAFVSKYKKIPYLQAVKEVADLVGIDFEYKDKKEFEVISPKVKSLYDISNDACMFYMNALKANKEALDYCHNRNIDTSIIEEFKIGYSPDSTSLIKYLTFKGYNKDDIFRSGLALEENGNLIDRFSKRLIFPIKNLEGKIVAFSGRRIENSDRAKYVNSPESDIFIKGNVLYHYFDALDKVKNDKKLYVCEGYMDCIALCKAGITNSIALMGTAFSKEHSRIIKYLGVEIILALDGDDPGIINARKIANLLTSQDINTSIIPGYKDVKDIDEYINKYGKEDLVSYLESAKLSPFDFNIFVAKRTSNLDNNETKKQFLYDMVKRVSMLSLVDQDIYINKLHDELGFSKSTIKSLIEENKKQSSDIPVMQVIHDYKKLNKYVEMQVRIISAMLDSKEAIQIFIDSLCYLPDESYRKISLIICDYYKDNENNLNMDHLVASLYSKVAIEYEEDEDLKKTLAMIDGYKENLPSYNFKTFNDIIYNLNEVCPLEEKLLRIAEDIKFANSNEEKNNLIKESLAIKLKLKELRDKKGFNYGRNV